MLTRLKDIHVSQDITRQLYKAYSLGNLAFDNMGTDQEQSLYYY
jgi:hypothetical protein